MGTEDLAFEMVYLTKSHPTLGELHICYAVDIDLEEFKTVSEIKETVWYSSQWQIPTLEEWKDAIWNIR